MKKFIINLLFYFLLLLFGFVLLIYLGSTVVKHRHFDNWETESNLLVIRPNTHYNYIFIGNSHCRNFSRHKNHLLTEKILDKKILNLGKTGANVGVNEYLVYLQYCFNHNVTADTIIHNVISQMYFSDHSNIAADAFEDEPFDFSFFWLVLKSSNIQNKWQKLYYYMRSKTYLKWITVKPYSLDSKTDSLLFIDTALISKNLADAFPTGRDTAKFNLYSAATERIIQLSLAHSIPIIFITTPTLFGRWPYSDDLTNFMKVMRKKYGVKYFDFSSAISEPCYFYDHHHLNTKGHKLFLENFLKPSLQGDTTYLVN